MSLSRILAMLVAVALLGAAGWWIYAPRPILVETASVVRGTFTATVEADGATRIRDRYVVSAALAGRLTRPAVHAGDRLAEGERIATILPALAPLLNARLREEATERVGAAEANVEAAAAVAARDEARLAQARIELTRREALAARGVVTERALEEAQLEVELAERDVTASRLRRQAAEHDLAQAKALLSRASAESGPTESWPVTAPITGRVLRVHVENETVVEAGIPLLEMGDDRALEVVVDVLTADAVAIQPGAEVRLTRWGGEPALEGRVRLVEPSGFTKLSALGVEEQRVNVVIDIVSPPALWASLGDQFRIEAVIVTQVRRDALLAPTTALFRRGEDWAAFIIQDGIARERIIRIAARSGATVAVDAGLAEGETVIIFPPSTLADGLSVEIAR